MEQYQSTTKQQKPSIDIQIARDGELKISGIGIEQLSDEQFVLLQEAIDEAKTRAKTYSHLQEIAGRDAQIQGVIAAIAILSALVLTSFAISRLIVNSFSSEPTSAVVHTYN